MTPNQAIETLKTQADSSPAVNAVLHAWAVRKRARNTVTLRALVQKMREEGFKYDAGDYALALKAMADAGFGRLETDRKGRVKALKDIRVKLQSIGAAVVAGTGGVKPFRQKPRYQEVKAPARRRKTVELPEQKEEQRVTPLYITVEINGKPVIFPVPAELTPEDIGYLVTRLRLA